MGISRTIQYTIFLGEIGHVTKCCPAHQVLDSYLQGCVSGVVFVVDSC